MIHEEAVIQDLPFICAGWGHSKNVAILSAETISNYIPKACSPTRSLFLFALVMSSTLRLFSALLGIIAVVLYRRSRNTNGSNPRRLPFPPGPKPDFIIGNARHIPAHSSWFQYTEWKKTFGMLLRYIYTLSSNSDDVFHQVTLFT